MPPQNFWLGARRATNFFRKKIRCFFLSAHANCRNLHHACMGGGAAPPGRYFPDGTWSCIPEHAVRSVNFIAEQQYSAPFPTHRMLLGAASSKFAHARPIGCVGTSTQTNLKTILKALRGQMWSLHKPKRARRLGVHAGMCSMVRLAQRRSQWRPSASMPCWPRVKGSRLLAREAKLGRSSLRAVTPAARVPGHAVIFLTKMCL